MFDPLNVNPRITLDQPVYAPGDVIQGRVVFNLKERLPLSVWLVFKGEERSQESNSKLPIEIFYGKTSILTDADFEEPGVYSAPFSFQLPRDLPDSRSFGDAGSKEIRYYVEYKSEYLEEDCVMMIDKMEPIKVRNPSSLNSKNAESDSQSCCFGGRGETAGQVTLAIAPADSVTELEPLEIEYLSVRN